MKTMTATLMIGFATLALSSPAAAGTDKTLVSWVILDNTTQQGGSALTIQRGDQFDGIVFGERAPGKWMAGSNFYARTQGDQQANAVEKADGKTLIQMAIVYKGNQISIYRNGEPYASYEVSNIDLLSAKDNMAVFGLRHEGAGTGRTLRGSIEDARIYDKALSADELKMLEPKKESAIKPYAWWTFEKGKETDRMGRFPVNNLADGAKIEHGRLVLPTEAATLIAATRQTLQLVQTGTETPAMPASPPANWLTYHLVHPGPGGAMPGDPNCAFYWKGRYHLHYIYNHKYGFAFAHVSSDDMVHWKWHPTTLHPKTTGHGMFSGTGFITKEGKPAIIYHGEGSGRNQLAFALDDNLEIWTRPVAIEPVTKDGTIPQMRHWDPDCWLNGDTYYAISGGGNPSLMKSSDLKNWKFLGPLLHDDYPTNIGMPKGEDISCANMFKIGKKWMLLCISHGLGCRYYLGDFKDEKYLPEFQAMMSWNGNNFFAPESVLSKDGRRVMWAWLLNLPIAPCGIQSLPRELELPEDGVLRIRPLRELQSLRYDRKQEEGITVKSDTVHRLKEISGDALELEVVLKSPAAKEFGMDVLCDKNGGNGLRVAVMAESKTLRVGNVRAPFEIKEGEDLTLRVFIDKNLVEVFANDRQAAVAAAGKYVPENLAVSLFSNGGDIMVKQVKCWKMKSIYSDGVKAAIPAASGQNVTQTGGMAKPAGSGSITYEPGPGAGQGKHIVFVCGEWEYRCEESLPMLAKILAKRHGFKCTVLFSMNPKDGTVDPSVRNNIPGMSVLKSADMMVLFAMDLTLPDEQMKPFVAFLETGKPVFGIRCTLLSFRYDKNSPYARFDVGNGGYATDLFGESWKGHYGDHGKESTRGLRAALKQSHPILNGVHDVWGPTDVYRVGKLPADATVLMYGQVLTGMNPTDPPNLKKSTMPMVSSGLPIRKRKAVIMATNRTPRTVAVLAAILWFTIASQAAKSQTAEAGTSPVLIEKTTVPSETIQAGFFTPARAGEIWDTWMYYHNGKYYMYYLAGPGGHWDGHELAISDDGVHWKEYGVVVRPRAGVTWMGTGHIWKAPDFDKTHRWVMNYSEWFGDKQDIMFVTSTDLLNWTKVDEKHRFVQDARWYKAKGRWDCIDAIQRPDGSLYGYFTADPDGAKVKYRPCGFGFAESKDGIAWTALPPVEGDISGEFGGIQKIGQKYYILISEGRVAVGDKPEGPFNTQKKNPNVFGAGCDIYFPRFFHTAPGGPLVNHFCTGGTVFAAPLKDVEIDSEGILRLKWWKNNDKLKAKPLETKLVAGGKEYASSLRMLDTKLDLSQTHVIEGTVGQVPPQAAGGGKPGIYFDLGNGQGCCLRLARDTVQFGDIKADGSNFKVLQTSRRDMDPGPVLKFRLVMKGDMMELYVNDYLMNLKRMNCNGQIGLIVADNAAAFKNIKIWQSN